MILLAKSSEKYQRSVMEVSFLLQNIAFRKLPKFCDIYWAMNARYRGNECPILVQSMPEACSPSSHSMGTR